NNGVHRSIYPITTSPHGARLIAWLALIPRTSHTSCALPTLPQTATFQYHEHAHNGQPPRRCI
ncbi:hypothetical protein C8Q74DRAFT_1301340, partial [Fomes fomentarius]